MLRRSVLALALVVAALPAAGPPTPPASVAILEDNAEELLKKFTNGPGADYGEGFVEKEVVFSGKSAIRIVPMQRYNQAIPDWAFRVVEKPGPGEYRYLRFAWKSDGCAGIMIQMFQQGRGWGTRYTAGSDKFGWGTKFVDKTPPAEWKMYTVDLFADFGEQTYVGLALTCFDGKAGYFDHIYLGRTKEDLDRIDATGPSGKMIDAREAAALWKQTDAADASAAYRAFWRLVKSPEVAAPFLLSALTPPDGDREKVRRWLVELDDDSAKVRDAAEERLKGHLATAAPLIEAALKTSPSAEVRRRARRLLEGRTGVEAVRARTERAVRALEYMNTPVAYKALRSLATGPDGAEATLAARAALARLGEGR